jgi:hypothetical protein
VKKKWRESLHTVRMMLFLAWWIAVISAGIIVGYLMLRP